MFKNGDLKFKHIFKFVRGKKRKKKPYILHYATSYSIGNVVSRIFIIMMLEMISIDIEIIFLSNFNSNELYYFDTRNE